MKDREFLRVDGTNIWLNCRVTVIAKPHFIAPRHLPVSHPETDKDMEDGDLLSEFAGRVCYMSQHNPAEKTLKEYVGNILTQGHGSVLEHQNFSVLLEGVSRSLTHELVRHRAGWSYSQLSQRYVGAQHVAFVVPVHLLAHPDLQAEAIGEFIKARASYVHWAERMSAVLPERGITKTERNKLVHQNARFVLPNSTETKLVATANIRAWRTFFEIRGSPHAEPEIRRCAVECLKAIKPMAPAALQDVSIVEDEKLESYPYRIDVLYHKV